MTGDLFMRFFISYLLALSTLLISL